jgi:hypothetical protein
MTEQEVQNALTNPNLQSLEGNQAITPQALQPQPTAPLPSATPTPAPTQSQNLASDLIATFDLSQQEQKAVEKRDSGLDQYLADLTGLEGQAQALKEEQNKAGVNTFRQELNNINSQILKKQAEVNQDDIQLVANMRAEERRDTLLPFAQIGQAKLAGDAQIVRALKFAEIGVLNAQALAKQGDISLAQQTAEEAVAVKYAPYKDRITTYENTLKALEPYLTSAEKKQAALQQTKGQMIMREIEKEEAREKEVFATAFALQKNGAPMAIVEQALKAKTVQEIQQIKGVSGFLLSQAERLDMSLKQAQIANTYAQMRERANAITKEEKEAQKLKEQNIARLPSIKDKIEDIRNLVTSKGLNSVVGTTALGRKSIVNNLTGEAQSFVAGVKNLISRETLDTLVNLKAQGGTLGALNEKELAMLENAASKIGAWEIKDKNGIGTGKFNASEKAFREELERLKMLTERAYINAGGTLPGSKGEETLVNVFLDSVDGALRQNPYINSGYNLQ